MRATFRVSLLAGLLLSVFQAGASAQMILVDPNPAGGAYTETAGTWVETSTRSTAEGVPQEGNSRILKPNEEGKLMGAVEFKSMVPLEGEYVLSMTWPNDANAKGVTVTIVGPAGESTQTLDFAPAGAEGSRANTWAELGRLALTDGAEVTVRILADTSTGPVDANKPYQLQIDALKLEVAGEEPAATDAAAPTPTPAAATDDDPFADVPPPDQAPPPVVANGAAPAASENPFEDAPAPAATPAAPATEDDPFANVPAPTTAAPATEAPAPADEPGAAPADPFAAAPADASSTVSDPFAGGTPTSTEDDPFANPTAGSPADPSASTPPANSAQPSDPFANPAETPVAEASAEGAPANPFTDPNAGPATSPAEDPFITPNNPSVAPEATSDDPFAQPATVVATPVATPVVGESAQTLEPTVNTEFTQPMIEEEPIDLPFRATLDDAVTAAKESNKRVIVLFSGESAQAKSFERLLSSDSLDETVGEFEIVRVDYRANRSMASKYSVRSFPYIVIVNKYGYTEGHVTPTTSGDSLAQKLQPFTQTLF